MFGEGGGRELAAEVDAPYLGSMALRAAYRDRGMPTALADAAVGEEYARVAGALRRSLREFGREAV